MTSARNGTTPSAHATSRTRTNRATIGSYSSLAPYDKLKAELLKCKAATVARAETEIEFWTEHVKEVEQYTREQAITELISALSGCARTRTRLRIMGYENPTL
jgi:hypothetical protein